MRETKGVLRMRIAENVEMLELASSTGIFYPVLLWDDSDVILIDTGLPETREDLLNQMNRIGFSPDSITKIILTHQDLDHIGNASFFANINAEIYASRLEKPYITGEKVLEKLDLLEHKGELRNSIEEIIYTVLKENASKCTVNVNQLLEYNEVLELCGGIKIIPTPGHTIGHISVLLQKSNLLIVGDAANINENALVPPDYDFCSQPKQAELSFERIKKIQVNGVVCYHSGFLNHLQP